MDKNNRTQLKNIKSYSRFSSYSSYSSYASYARMSFYLKTGNRPGGREHVQILQIGSDEDTEGHYSKLRDLALVIRKPWPEAYPIQTLIHSQINIMLCSLRHFSPWSLWVAVLHTTKKGKGQINM